MAAEVAKLLTELRRAVFTAPEDQGLGQAEDVAQDGGKGTAIPGLTRACLATLHGSAPATTSTGGAALPAGHLPASTCSSANARLEPLPPPPPPPTPLDF